MVCIRRYQKYDNANYDQIVLNSDMALKTMQRVQKLFGSIKTDLWAKDVGEPSFMLYGKMGWLALFCPSTWLLQL